MALSLFLAEVSWNTLKEQAKQNDLTMIYLAKQENKLNCWSKLRNCFNQKERYRMSFLQPREYPSAILAKDSQTALTATALAAAGNANQRYYITGVDASYGAAQIGLLQLKDDTTVIWEGFVQNAAFIPFNSPISSLLAGKSFSAVLAAGAAGIVGKVNLRGYLI